jgi:hypothetical protein
MLVADLDLLREPQVGDLTMNSDLRADPEYPPVKPEYLPLLIGAVLFVLSLISPCVRLVFSPGGGEVCNGFYILMSGWMGPLVGNVAWAANPLALLALVLLLVDMVQAARLISAMAVVVSLQTMAFPGTVIVSGGPFPGSEQATGLACGAFVWMLSILFVLLACLAAQPVKRVKTLGCRRHGLYGSGSMVK